MNYIFAPSPPVGVGVVGKEERFPVHRVYCLVRNYSDHAKEMGFSGQEDPFFFLKPADPHALIVVDEDQLGEVRYPSLTRALYHEVELVTAIGMGGKNIQLADAHKHIYGYAVGLDMTRRDLQLEMEKSGRPWCIGKAFDDSAVIGPITPVDQVDMITFSEINLQVNGQIRQHSNLMEWIWGVSKIIEQLSKAWHLHSGDLIYTGTPAGVSAVLPGDQLVGSIEGLSPLRAHICCATDVDGK